MRASTAYFAGAGTVAAAIVAGVGGGLLFGNIVSPTTPKHGTETTLLERRMQQAPIRATTAPSEPVPYLAAPQLPGPGAAVTAAAAQTESVKQVAGAPSQAPTPTEPVKQTEQVNAAPATPAAASTTTVAPPAANTNTAATVAAPAAHPAAPPSPPAVATTQEQRTAPPEDAFAKARDANAKRDADTRRTAEKRRFEHRQQWVEKRRYRSRQDQELQAVEQAVREQTEPRRERVLAVEPVRSEMPQIRLFGPE
jgi:hypothetical protein